EMPAELQTKLLRFVQTGSFQPVGSGRIEKVDVRFICATNRDPRQEVDEGRFREDLYYRLHVIPLHLPPLREREDDVLAIARHFLVEYAAEEGRRFQGFRADTEAVLLEYGWPGNVRELQNVVRNIVVLNDAGEVTPQMLPAPLSRVVAAGEAAVTARSESREVPPATALAAELPPGDPTLRIRPLEQVERELIEDAIAACDGNIPKAAALLEISASTIYRKRQAWADADAAHSA
ncbi:MAG TPA: sigma 54-interacting transcriptional regulator, partial [Plasticicumulans sp.]|nr:sigma 54-interacting transcriptional regulator [Plasticicumulans sp.]